MSIIKSLSVGYGDMYYIRHNSDNFTIIDCYLDDDNVEDILQELKTEIAKKGIIRFISTHPDNDHIGGLKILDDELKLVNFYCVKNEAEKIEFTEDFHRYCELRDSSKAFYIYKGCSRKWMNLDDETRGSSGINILWPDTENEYFKQELINAQKAIKFNNISPIIKYAISDGVKFLWFGDLESDFMEDISDSITFQKADIIFAPHHGRISGKIPQMWLDQIDPKIVVIGEAPANELEYYHGYNRITQNSAGSIIFDCGDEKRIRIYVSNSNYHVSYLENDYLENYCGHKYLGTLGI